jgi:D-alanyl-lipoteichoic acid acyltransferase DltB (MBOAT superfamily)
MLFNSLEFLIFLTVVTVAFGLVHRHLGLRNSFLLAASYAFYGAWDWRFLGLILLSTVVDYTVARKLPGSGHNRRRGLVAISLVTNLGLLGTFKYLDFGVASFAELVSLFGLEADLRTLGIVLPVGISFYTFQTIGYTLDVAAGRRLPVTNFRDFALFVAYFPQLVAGPIERSTRLLPQLQKVTRPGRSHFRRGLLWILSGYVLKVACADTVAPLVDEAYARADTIGGPVLLLASLGFTLQIFCDFAGYSLIARGVSEWFGIHLMENFRSPYISQSPREFWRRWHISLSTWLRDYLYIPLGGNRRGRLRTSLNLLLVFTLCGLWHGAGWNFIAFGTFWGLWLALYRPYVEIMQDRTRRAPDSFGARWFRNAIPLAAFIKGLTVLAGAMVSFIFFRSPDLGTALGIIGAIAVDWHFDPSFTFYLRSIGILFILVWGYSWLQHHFDDQDFLLEAPPWIRWTLGSFAVLTLLSIGFRPVPFIYFQF